MPSTRRRLVFMRNCCPRVTTGWSTFFPPFDHEIEPFWQDGSMKTPMDMYEFPGFVLKLENGTELHLDAPPLTKDGIYLLMTLH
jgi:hypothetical protein